MTPTPEALRTLLEERLGEKEGEAAWFVLLEALEGRRFYWPKAVRRAHLARTVYEWRTGGKSVTAIMAGLQMSRSTVERLYKAELMRRRTMRQTLAKHESRATHAFRRGETTP